MIWTIIIWFWLRYSWQFRILMKSNVVSTATIFKIIHSRLYLMNGFRILVSSYRSSRIECRIKCSCSNSCPGSKIPTHHSYSEISWLKFLNELNIKSSLSLTKFSIPLKPSYLYDLVSIQPPHGRNTCSSPYVTLIKPPSPLKVTDRSSRHASPHLWNKLPTSFRIPYPNYSSPSHAATFIWTCRFNLLHNAITFHHCFTELKTYLFRKSYRPPLSVSVCRTDLMALDRSPDLFAHRFYFFVLFFSVLVIPTCGRLSWPALWSTFGRTIK